MKRKNTRWNKPHVVYLLKLGNEIVYVGCTYNLEQRLKFHKGKVYTEVEVFKFDKKWPALLKERKVLWEYLPKYNWAPPHLVVSHEKNFGTRNV